jgi:hypothetical protein
VVVACTLLGAAPAAAVENPGVPVSTAPGVPGNGRAWELLTPADPVSAQIAAPRAIGVDGEKFAYFTLGRLPGASGSRDLFGPALARRSSNGWVSEPIPDPGVEPGAIFSFGPEAFGPNLDEMLWASALPLGQTGTGIFRWGADGGYELLAQVPTTVRVVSPTWRERWPRSAGAC